MIIAIHEMKRHAHCYTWNGVKLRVKLYAHSYTSSEALYMK